jgi:dipeptidyl aminopeptidase/acylaminoacyl peptidase/tetratricopeptide (TPR) repeat protein
MPFALSHRRFAAAVLGLAILLAPRAVAAAGRRPIAETDLFRFVWIADPQISPDGRQIVFVRVTVNENKEGYDTALWIVPTEGGGPARPFTGGPRDLSPRWSPDGATIAFTRSAEREGQRQPPQIYLISLKGGEAVPLTDLPQGAAGHSWSPDGRTLAFLSTTNAEDLEKKGSKGKGDGGEERVSDVRVITRAEFRSDGGGYAEPGRHAHIWTVGVPAPGAGAPEPKQITRGELDEDAPVWSPDGKLLVFAANRDPEALYAPPDSDLYAVPSEGGEIFKLLDMDGAAAAPFFSPDGRRMAFAGVLDSGSVRSHNQVDLFVAEAEPGAEVRNLTAHYDGDIGKGLAADQHPPRGGRPGSAVWSRDGRSIYVIAGERGRINLKRIDAATGAVRPLTEGPQEIVSYTATPDGTRIAMVVSTATVISDLHVLDTATGRSTVLVRPNEELFAQLEITEPEEITYRSFDGREIHAFVQKPPGFDPAKKYPLILNIHGGPHSAYGHAFFHEMHWMAAKGYVVLYPNPRGSATYGQEFGNVIQYRFPGDDAKDLLAGVDEMVKRGSIDPKRLGVTGGSGGGLLTNWIITQTDRFAAAVAQRSIADWASFWYTADVALFTPSWFRGAPWEDPEDFARRSPITHVAKITTPLMLIEGEADHRTPPGAGGEMMFRALKYLKKPVVMVRFPGEPHDFSRTGRPWHRVERLRHILAWFDKYLMGAKIDAYGVGPAPEATSLLGEPLFAPELPPEVRADREAKLAEARAAWEAAPDDADAVLWLGRRTAYLGRYREAVEIFSAGIAKHPEDARLYRHRGHRFLTLRDFDRAIADLATAARLVEGRPDEVEPDGLPNARNIPTSTLQSNIWYHLGLAHYLKGDFAKALAAYRECLKVSTNPDMLAATTHWLYMTLRRLGREEEAARVLAPITADMDVIENRAYHRLLLMYKGELAPDDLRRGADGDLDPPTLGYGLGNWHLYNGRREEAVRTFREVVVRGPWAAFGAIAAEADLKRLGS